MQHRRGILEILTITLCLALVCACGNESGKIKDEALRANRTAASFVHAGEDYFHDMDGAIALSPDEVKGRNMWLVWSGGNDRLWDELTRSAFGAFDLLKIISSHPSLGYSRANRWEYLGLVNEPCFKAATGPNKERRGLWLDERTSDCPADPFADETRYPGVALGSRGHPLGDGTTQPVGSFYGYPTGVLGLRLFPNPDFDAMAARRWDPVRYYTDPSYYNRKDLVRPYRVGMTCGFCHVGPSPVKPPANPDEPAYMNLSSSVGAQYLWIDRVFAFDADQSARRRSFFVQVLQTFRPGTLDTSLVSTDNINNPRTMNALYNLGARMAVADQFWHERLAGGELNNKQFNDYTALSAFSHFYDSPTATVRTPHILKDGSDSVGMLGALNRVYLNIGVFSEEWLTHFNPLVGGKAVTPVPVASAERNSVYWWATEAGTPYMAEFLLKAGRPDLLRDAPGGEGYLRRDTATLRRGKEIFADTCARCHSSKLPQPPAQLHLEAARCTGAGYLQCFKAYWDWTRTAAFRQQMRAIVMQPDFLDGNYLSSDARIPVTLLRTNICSPLATNALAGNIWDNFSSQSYKQLPSVGTVTIYDPFTGDRVPYKMPAGGRGYTRVPSLVSIWSTAPFLLNNTVGPFDPDPSVATRMTVFQASIEQLLWPEKRASDPLLGAKIPGIIDRTTATSRITIPAGFVPRPLQSLATPAHAWLPRFIDQSGDIELGPIPKGMPVGLLANLQPLAESDSPALQAQHLAKLTDALWGLKNDLIASGSLSDAELAQRLGNLGRPLLALSKCPDFVVNRGHYFGTAMFNDPNLTADEQAFGTEPALSEADKGALIEFLKTF